MEQLEKTAEIINDLVKINNDRIEGYRTAIEETKETDVDLKLTFAEMVSQSEQYRKELSDLVAQLGEQPENSTRTDGKIYRAWMDIKATLAGNSRKSVLDNCEFGEDAAQKAYIVALESDGELSADARALLVRQQQALKTSHDVIKKMRNMAN